jgi:protease-4
MMDLFPRRITEPCRISLVAAAAFALLVAPSAPAAAQDEPTPTEGMVLPDESITTRADATSLELNPAGLGFMQGGQLAVGLQRADSEHEGVAQEGVGVFLAGGNGTFGGGFSVEWLDRGDLGAASSEYRKYTFGAALSSDSNLSFGAAFNFFGSSRNETLDDLTSWDLGMMWRPSENLGFGLRARDLNQPFFQPAGGSTGDPTDNSPGDERAGEALPVRFGVGAALRFWQGRAILDPAVEFTSNGDSIFLRPRLMIEPFPGVRFFARTEFDFEFDEGSSTSVWNQTVAGLALNTGGLGVESAFIADLGDDSEHLGSTHLVWIGSQRERGIDSRDRRWVLVNLNGNIAEQPSSGFFAPNNRSFMSLVVQLEQLAEDDGIEGVVFNVGASGLGYAQIWEVRQAIDRLRAAGKETVSVLTNPTFRETYLASAAERLWLIPPQPYAPDGLTINMTSYAQTLAMAGIQAEFLRIGRFKSAPESYTFREPSDEALAQITDYLDGL